ncbi:MAG: hypothetical protein AABZ31_09545 [Bdellovibrionota bacterium]
MNWSAEKITELRLCLGWSVADFSRRFGATSATIQSWEAGQSLPTADDLRQLDFLSFHLTSYSDVIEAQPKADAVILNNNYEQVHRELTRKE